MLTDLFVMQEMRCKKCYKADKWIIFINVDLFTNLRIISFSFSLKKLIYLLNK